MGIGSIGSVGSTSFWQDDQNFWNQAQSQAQSSAQSNALINAMGSLMTNQVKGLASIANKTALARVNAQLTAALQSAVQTATGGAAASASSTPSSSIGTPATGTGTVPLLASTALITLGIPAGGTVTVNDGTNTTTYASTGTDTVADLIGAINKIAYGHAQVTASLDSSGKLNSDGQQCHRLDLGWGTFRIKYRLRRQEQQFPARRTYVQHCQLFQHADVFKFFERGGVCDKRKQFERRFHPVRRAV